MNVRIIYSLHCMNYIIASSKSFCFVYEQEPGCKKPLKLSIFFTNQSINQSMNGVFLERQTAAAVKNIISRSEINLISFICSLGVCCIFTLGETKKGGKEIVHIL